MRIVCLVIAIAACSTPSKREEAQRQVPKPSTPAPATPNVFLGTASGERGIAAEVVSSGPLLEKGLMFREFLDPDGGMLFLMGKDYDWQFYMHNTLIPLDMIFIQSDGIIAGIVENATPRTEDLRGVNKPSRYVLEVNGGWTRAHGVYPGAKVRFRDIPGT